MRTAARTRSCRSSTAHPMAFVTSGARSCSPPNPSPGQDERAFGTVEPLWNFIDLTPGGRPDWNVDIDDHGPSKAKPALIAAK